MDKGKVDENEGAPNLQPKVDRFGFVKSGTKSPDRLAGTRSASEYERYANL